MIQIIYKKINVYKEIHIKFKAVPHLNLPLCNITVNLTRPTCNEYKTQVKDKMQDDHT